MKRALLLVLGLACAAQAFAGPGLRLENDGNALVYFVTLPKAVVADPARLDLEQIAGLVDRYRSDFAYLPAKAVMPAWPLGSEASWLFLLVAESSGYSPRFLNLPAASKVKVGVDSFLSLSRSTVINDANGFPLNLASIDLARLGAETFRIDGRFSEWLAEPAALSSRNGQALNVKRSLQGQTVAIKPADAVSYGRGGTDLDKIKLAGDRLGWYSMLAVRSPLARGTSLVYRLYTPDSRESFIFFEIPVLDEGGPVLLWRKGMADPVHCGDYAQIGLFLEARIRRSDLPVDIQKILATKGSRLSVHLIHSDGSFSEDWSYGEISNVQESYSRGL